MRFSFKDIIKTIVISLGWFITISIIGVIIIVFLDNPDFDQYLFGILFILVFIMTMFTINKHLLRKNGLGWDSLGFIPLKKKQILNLVWHVPLCYISILLVGLIFSIVFYGDIRNLPDTESSAQIIKFTPFIFILVFLTHAIFTPILEEIIFRGGLLQALESKFNVPVAVIGSSLLFTLVHGFSFITPALFMGSLLLAYLYIKYRSIYAPIILHIFINGINVIVVNINL